MNEQFALRCLVDAVERLPHRHSLDEVCSELVTYLDAIGETSASNTLRGVAYAGGRDYDRLLDHLQAETLDEVLSVAWTRVPVGMDPDAADALLDVVEATNG